MKAKSPRLPVRLEGQLIVAVDPTRNGGFRRKTIIVTPQGHFHVEHNMLDQYPEGKYDGEFWFQLFFIKSSSTVWSSFNVLSAALQRMKLSHITPLDEEEAKPLRMQAVDPLEDEATAPAPIASTAAPTQRAGQPRRPPMKASSSATADSPPTATTSSAGDEALFGSLWPLSDVVRLDSTHDRLVLRAQITRLRQLGYEFRPLPNQDWARSGA